MKDKEIKSNSDVYEVYLGTFIDNAFTWYSISKHKDATEAYKEFKKYVNTQLKYTDEELKQVWDTGRLDIELRQGNKLLNWVGIYSRQVNALSEAEEKEAEEAKVKKAPKGKGKKDSVNDAAKAAHYFRLDKRKNEYDEFVVKEYVNGKFQEDGSYYTDDWNDAVETLYAMAEDSGMSVTKAGAGYVALPDQDFKLEFQFKDSGKFVGNEWDFEHEQGGDPDLLKFDHLPDSSEVRDRLRQITRQMEMFYNRDVDVSSEDGSIRVDFYNVWVVGPEGKYPFEDFSESFVVDRKYGAEPMKDSALPDLDAMEEDYDSDDPRFRYFLTFNVYEENMNWSGQERELIEDLEGITDAWYLFDHEPSQQEVQERIFTMNDALKKEYETFNRNDWDGGYSGKTFTLEFYRIKLNEFTGYGVNRAIKEYKPFSMSFTLD